jgi:hypothetical protein
MPALTLRKSDTLADWYSIEKAEHDGRTWLEKNTELGCMEIMYSGRISNADVEGTADEMLAIAAAIENRSDVCFERCSVEVCGGLTHFDSPRNSTRPGTVTLAEADALAKEIRAKLGETQTTKAKAAE